MQLGLFKNYGIFFPTEAAPRVTETSDVTSSDEAREDDKKEMSGGETSDYEKRRESIDTGKVCYCPLLN